MLFLTYSYQLYFLLMVFLCGIIALAGCKINGVYWFVIINAGECLRILYAVHDVVVLGRSRVAYKTIVENRLHHPALCDLNRHISFSGKRFWHFWHGFLLEEKRLFFLGGCGMHVAIVHHGIVSVVGWVLDELVKTIVNNFGIQKTAICLVEIQIYLASLPKSKIYQLWVTIHVRGWRFFLFLFAIHVAAALFFATDRMNFLKDGDHWVLILLSYLTRVSLWCIMVWAHIILNGVVKIIILIVGLVKDYLVV